MYKFSSMYVVYMLVMFILFFYQSAINFQGIYTDFVNHITVYFLNFFGMYAIHSGENILLSSSILEVKFGCNGLEAVLILVAAILAYTTEFKVKLLWLFKGIFFLMMFNFLRLLILSFVLNNYREYFNFMHDYVTQDIMIFVAIIIFILFIQDSRRKKNERRIQEY